MLEYSRVYSYSYNHGKERCYISWLRWLGWTGGKHNILMDIK